MPYYHLYEMNHAALSPLRAAADMTRYYFKNPINPLSHTTFGRSVAASCELFERTTRRYSKPVFDLNETTVDGIRVPVREKIVWKRPFANLIHFERIMPSNHKQNPKLLIVAPMSGHYSTLLRGTVETLMQNHEVYITDWIDARMVPLTDGKFDLDDYIDYVISMLHKLGPDTHVLAVCQPSVPVLAAVAVMEEQDDPYAPSTMTLMGGPIDTRVNPTAVNNLAEEKGMDWFENNVIMKVPFPHPGFMRDVYPGFLQLSGFMSMNLDRHVSAHQDLFQHLVEGDGDSAERHRDFYDEYLAVMDLTAEFYLQTVKAVFIDHALPNGKMTHHGKQVDTTAIRNTALFTVEGEKDDISGVGQTEAAHRICSNIPEDKRAHYLQPGVGHYGVFNGSRFRSEIAPRISDFILTHDGAAGIKTETPPKKVRPALVKKSSQPRKKQSRKTLAAMLLSKPKGAADDLKLISGVGPKLEKTLNEIGIFHYWQIAGLEKTHISELDDKLAFKGRINRDKWIEQARGLADA
ncbi:MAG: polyhydroxyalkanoate depolymerase [Stappiaceae bacterium]